MLKQPREWILIECIICHLGFSWPRGDPPPRLHTCDAIPCISEAARAERRQESFAAYYPRQEETR